MNAPLENISTLLSNKSSFIPKFSLFSSTQLSEKEMAEESEIFRFFRPLMNNFRTMLFIPAHLAEHISMAKSRDKVTLMNHKCKMWHVDLHIENKDLYFGGESWQNFVQDNDLEVGHLLFFKYKGNMVFSFRIYDLTSCERTSRKKKIAKEEIDVEESSKSTTEEAVGCSRKRRGKEVQSSSEAMHEARSNKNKRGDQDPNASENAYFEANITAANLKRYYLYIPVGFIECSGLSSEHTGFSIRDHEGRTWLVGVLHNGSNIRMGKGWGKFSKENQLKEGDKVRFELVSVKGEDSRVMHLSMIKL